VNRRLLNLKSVETAQKPKGFEQYGLCDPDWLRCKKQSRGGGSFLIVRRAQADHNVSIDRCHDGGSHRVQRRHPSGKAFSLFLWTGDSPRLRPDGLTGIDKPESPSLSWAGCGVRRERLASASSVRIVARRLMFPGHQTPPPVGPAHPLRLHCSIYGKTYTP
jgi:hypothetical protein